MNNLLRILTFQNLPGVGKGRFNTVFLPLLVDDVPEDSLWIRCVAALEAKGIKVRREDILRAGQTAKTQMVSIGSDPSVQAITVFDDAYPARLRDLGSSKPPVIYVRGDANALSSPSVAVIGTQDPSRWSRAVEVRLVRKLLELSDRVIVGGLAKGCDGIAHETTMNTGSRTAAVLPGGVNRIWPPEHEQMASRIIDTGGCLISEYPPNTASQKFMVYARSEIIAALSDAVIAIECGKKSAAMHVAKEAQKMNRPLACYFTDETSKGNYEGNYAMVLSMGAVRLRGTGDLEQFLASL